MTARIVLGLSLALPCLPNVAHASAAEPAPETSVPSPTPTETPAPRVDAEGDDLRRAQRTRMGGLVTMGIGMGFIVIGGGIAGGYSTGAVGAKALWAGVGLAAFGVVPTIIGGVVYGVGNRKVTRLQAQRAASLRVAPLAGRGTGGLVFGGRF